MHVESFTFNPFQENTYVCHDASEAAIIDPGSSNAHERARLRDYLALNNLKVTHLLLTHAHIDHIIDCAYYTELFELEWWMHEEDVPLLGAAREQSLLFGIDMVEPPAPGRLIDERNTIRLGEAEWNILHCPGHSPGSICFYDKAGGFVIAGDVVFRGSVGRTDLWKGSMEQLLDSIRRNILTLPDETLIYPGHGPSTTVGEEKRMNPFLSDER